MISDKELDEIIKSPRPQFGPLQAKDILIYIDTSCGIEHQSWRYMDKSRMIELFDRLEKIGYHEERTHERVRLALKELKKK